MPEGNRYSFSGGPFETEDGEVREKRREQEIRREHRGVLHMTLMATKDVVFHEDYFAG